MSTSQTGFLTGRNIAIYKIFLYKVFFTLDLITHSLNG